MTLTESLAWLKDIHREVYVNSVDRTMPPQFFGFHNVSKSSTLVRPFNRNSLSSYPIRKIPCVQSYFMASYPNTHYIRSIKSNIEKIIKLEPENILDFFNDHLKFQP